MVEISVYLESEAILTRELGPGEYTLGRLPENDLVLSHHEVSRRHARLVVGERGEVSVEDLGSTNGVLLDGVPVGKTPWPPGQVVLIKPYELRLRLLAPQSPGAGEATVLMAPAHPQAATVLMALPQPRLLVVSGKASAPEFQLARGTTLLGRSEDCQIRLTDPSVSRRHAQIEVDAEGVTLRDLDSSGGTLLNGEKISQAALKPGDRIGVGSVTLELAGPTVAAPDPVAGRAPGQAQPTQPKGEAAGQARSAGRKKPMLLAALAVLVAGGIAAAMFLGKDKNAPPKPAPVAVQMAQERQRQEEDERRRIVIISLTKAREAYLQGQFQAAIPLLNTVLAADPGNTEAREILEKSNTAMAQAEAARQKVQQEAQARAQRLAILGQQIQVAFRDGQHHKVLEIAREMQALDPPNQVARDLANKSQAALEQEEQKRRSVKTANERREQEAKRSYEAGVQHLQSGNLVEAMRSWHRVVELDPRGETPWSAKARGHIEQARPQLKAKGDEKYAQGQAQLKAGDMPGAMASFQEAMRADPWHSQAKAALEDLQSRNAHRVDELMQEAEVLVGLGDVKAGIAKWREALGLVAPGSPRAAAIKANIGKYSR